MTEQKQIERISATVTTRLNRASIAQIVSRTKGQLSAQSGASRSIPTSALDQAALKRNPVIRRASKPAQDVDVASPVRTGFQAGIAGMNTILQRHTEEARAAARNIVRRPPPPRPVPPQPQMPAQPVQPVPVAPPPPIRRARSAQPSAFIGQAPSQAPVAGVPRTLNNYVSVVTIDPSGMKEWQDVLAFLRNLKRRGRALRPEHDARLYPWMTDAEQEDLEMTNLSYDELINAGWSEEDAKWFVLLQEAKQDVYAGLDTRLRELDLGDAMAHSKWREERHTRFKPKPGEKPPLGPSGAPRKRGQFYFNTKFKGALYTVPLLEKSRKLGAKARESVERYREHQYQLLQQYGSLPGLSYERFTPIEKKARLFLPSLHGEGRIKVKSEGVDYYALKKVYRILTGSSHRDIQRLLQND